MTSAHEPSARRNRNSSLQISPPPSMTARRPEMTRAWSSGWIRSIHQAADGDVLGMDEAAAGAPEQVVGVVAEHATDGGAGVLDAAQGVAQHDAVLAVFDERAEAPADRLGLGPAGPLGGEQPRVVDRDRRVLGDAAERTLLGVGEPARDAHGDRQHADDGAAGADRHA